MQARPHFVHTLSTLGLSTLALTVVHVFPVLSFVHPGRSPVGPSRHGCTPGCIGQLQGQGNGAGVYLRVLNECGIQRKIFRSVQLHPAELSWVQTRGHPHNRVGLARLLNAGQHCSCVVLGRNAGCSRPPGSSSSQARQWRRV